MDRPADLLDDLPVGALALAVLVAAAGYGAVNYLVFGRLDLLQTVVFAVVFTVVYVAFVPYFDV